MTNNSVLTAEYTLSPEFQRGIMRNVEGKITKIDRKRFRNWELVEQYLLQHTSNGGSCSCYQHCLWMGVNPDGYTFR